MAAQKLQFVTTDAFTSEPYTGNPLALVRLPSSAMLRQDQKQKMAREFNLSETVFLHESKESYKNREWVFDIFIPSQEIPFAGHPTIGTICYLGRVLEANGASGVISGTLQCKAGPIPWTYDSATGTAAAEIPHDSHLHSKCLDIQELQDHGVSEAVTADVVSPSPLFSIVKGVTFCLVELTSLEAMGAVAKGYKPLPFEGLTPEYAADGIIAFLFYHISNEGTTDSSTSPSTRKFRTRMILNNLEDPATGAASAALAVYVAKYRPGLRQPGQDVHRFEFTQGVEIGRRSKLGSEVVLGKAGKVEKVMLRGASVEIMEGTINVP